jgi:hypothetical protein
MTESLEMYMVKELRRLEVVDVGELRIPVVT